jgi:hypothetical protein
MTSSSSLYSTPPNQDVSSTNSTSLYGGADTPIPDSSGNLVVRGDLVVLSGNILTTATTGNIFPANATTVNLGNAATTVNIGANTGTTTINNDLVVDGGVTAGGADFGNITIAVADDNTISTTSGDLKLTSTTNNINLTQGLTFTYSEANNRLNRPNVQSTTGNTSGLRVSAPNATTSAAAVVSAFSSNDDLNGKYINFQARGSSTDPLRITTGEYVAGVLQASGDSIAFRDGSDPTYATINPAGPTVGTDLTTKSYVDSIPNVSYTIDASATTGGANFNLVGSDASTDTIKFAQGTGISVTRTDANTITITNTAPDTTVTYTQNISSTTGGANLNLVGSDSTTDTVKFANGTGVTVSYTDASTATIAIGQAVATTDDVVFNSVNTPNVFGGGPLTLTGGTVTPSNIAVGDDIVASLTGGIGGDTATLTANAGSLTWNHVAGPMVFGSVSAAWSLNVDGTTSFPNYTFPFADGSADQVLKTDGAGNLVWYSPSDLNTTYTIDASATTGGANLNLVGSDSTTDTVKISGSGATTVAQTSANEITVSSVDTNTTYTQDASATTGGANVNLVGSDSTTDTIKYAGAGSVTVVATDANTVTITGTDTNTTYTVDATSTTGGANLNLVGSDSTTDSVAYLGSGATTVTRTDANTITISSTDNDTTYTIDASATTGGANVNLVGSDSTTDTIKFSGAGATTVSQTSANEVTITSTDNNTTYTQDVSSTTGGANLNLIGSDSTTDSVKFAGGTNVTVVATDANTMTINATDTNTTYDFNATSTTGGANLNLVGSDSTTDTVKISSGTGVTVNQVSGTEVSVAIGQAVGTGDSPSFAGVSAGNISVGVATDNTIASTDTNGDIILDPNGSGEIVLSSIVRALGELQATTNINYTFPPQTLNTVTDNNGYSAASSFPAGTNGYGANASFTHYYGDTLAGTATAPAFNFRNANGNSTAGDTVPFTGLTSVAPSATLSGNVMGTLNFNGYGTSGFTNDTASQYQGGGINALQSMQIQSYPTENFSDSTLTLTSANVTAVASSFRAALGAPSVTGTKGQISFNSTTIAVGQAIRVTGTLTGTATGIVSGQSYYVIVTNGSTTATLSATPGGSPINTTAGTLTGLTLTRCGVTFTTTGLTNVPFGRGALVTVSGVTNVTDGTYPVWGTPTTTSFALGIPHTVAPSVAGAQSFSCLSTYMGSGIRIRAFPLATPANLQNRLELLDMTPASTTLRSSTLTLNTGAYGNTGVGITGDKIVYNRVYGQWQNTTTIVPAANDTAYAFALPTVDFTNIASVGSTSRIIPGAAGMYKLQFSVQVQNDDSAAEHTAYFWWRKNGTDVPGSMGRVGVVKATGTINGLTIAGWDNIISSANATDYWELMYAVDDATHVDFPTFSSTAFGPSTSALFVTLVPVGA